MDQAAGISAILFDADGVVQRARPGWRAQLGSCVAPEAAETFIAEVFAAELTVLAGGDFPSTLQRVLDRWQVDRPVREVLKVWDAVIVDSRMITAIQRLRRGRIRCYLATNQQNFRRGVMHALPWYDDGFDDQFYSCELGLAKPDRAYFSEILRRIDTPAEQVLFLDDNKINVDAARSIGIQAELFPRDAGVAALAPLLSGYRPAAGIGAGVA
ncbi:HAD family hydrolase [Microlunatus parietis]|uniref:Putative hydrolase of the HAD superfamily n=1 Tax=Microlunatus parietis TaxID=682979 RepID=A0A7Y9I7H2_9ACTN|nr:HAD-IA family hydrolase [Microlunatus parietis]NYE71703.1 putative hydrolase of the HAD superfamily [Microlunatus parietis]